MIDIIEVHDETEIEVLRRAVKEQKRQLDAEDSENDKLCAMLENAPALFGTHVSSGRPVFELDGVLYIGEPFVKR